MKRRSRNIVLALTAVWMASGGSAVARAEITVAGRELQFHGFFSQGFRRADRFVSPMEA